MLGKSSHTPWILNAKPEGADLQGGQPRGLKSEPEAGFKQLQMRVVPEIHTVCAGEKTWSSGWWRYANPAAFSAWVSQEEGIWHLHGLQKHLIQNICKAWRTAWSHLKVTEATLTAGLPLSPHLNKTSETGLFFLGPFSSLFPCLWEFLLKYWFSQIL